MTFALIVFSVLMVLLVLIKQLHIRTQRKEMDVLARQADYYYRRLSLYEDDEENAGDEPEVI